MSSGHNLQKTWNFLFDCLLMPISVSLVCKCLGSIWTSFYKKNNAIFFNFYNLPSVPLLSQTNSLFSLKKFSQENQYQCILNIFFRPSDPTHFVFISVFSFSLEKIIYCFFLSYKVICLCCRYGVTPFTPMKGILFQGPVFVCFFLAVR